MKKEKAVLFAAVMILAACVLTLVEIRTHAQSPSTTSSPVSAAPVQSPAGPVDASNPVDIQGKARYLVGPGDVLDVRVFGQQELNSTVEIDDEGNISSLPFLEDPLPVMCHTEKDIQKVISKAYGKYIKNPRVSVRVIERKSRPPAVVYGAVRSPTRIQMMRRVRLHELLVAAGGVTMSASGKIQIVHTESEMCPQDALPIPDIAEVMANKLGGDTTYEKSSASSSDKPVMTPVSNTSPASSTTSTSATAETEVKLQDKPAADSAKDNSTKENATTQKSGKDSDIGKIEVYEVGDVRTGTGQDDPYIRPGDIVIVTEGEPIYITGYLVAPREIVMKDNMTLSRAIYMAGGLQRTAKSTVFIYRQVKGKIGPEKLKFDFEAIKDGKAPDVPLQAYDIVDVRPQSSLSAGNLRDIFLGITKSTITGAGGALPYRIIY